MAGNVNFNRNFRAVCLAEENNNPSKSSLYSIWPCETANCRNLSIHRHANPIHLHHRRCGSYSLVTCYANNVHPPINSPQFRILGSIAFGISYFVIPSAENYPNTTFVLGKLASTPYLLTAEIDHGNDW